jgi:hypothetical protein
MEALFENMDENQINMEFMNGSIEIIAQSALTLAYTTGKDDEEVSAAMEKAAAELMKNKESNDALRQYVRDMLSQQKANQRAEKMAKNKTS